MEFDVNFNIWGGSRSSGTYEGNDYDKIKFVSLCEDENSFGYGKPVILSFPTKKVLASLALASYAELIALKYPLKIRVHYSFNANGQPYPSEFKKI